jgi:hypothetical protein
MLLTNDQQAAIHGESSFVFDTFIGLGHSAVSVKMAYEYDASGSYNETIINVLTMSGLDIMDYLEESVIDELCSLGCMLLEQSKEEVY